MQLMILGSGTSIIKKDRLAPGYLIELDSGESLLFDCGATTAQQFANINFDYSKLDHILISHPHPDHIGGLISLCHGILLESMYRKYLGKEARNKDKTLFFHGYPGFAKDLKILLKIMAPELLDGSLDFFPIKVIEQRNQQVKYPGFTLITKVVSHVDKYFKSIAFRLEADRKVFAYSGDSRYCEQLIELSRDADLVLFESSSLAKGLSGETHLTPRGAGTIVQRAAAKKLVLTHHYDVRPQAKILEEARKYFSGEIIMAKDLMEIKI